MSNQKKNNFNESYRTDMREFVLFYSKSWPSFLQIPRPIPGQSQDNQILVGVITTFASVSSRTTMGAVIIGGMVSNFFFFYFFFLGGLLKGVFVFRHIAELLKPFLFAIEFPNWFMTSWLSHHRLPRWRAGGSLLLWEPSTDSYTCTREWRGQTRPRRGRSRGSTWTTWPASSSWLWIWPVPTVATKYNSKKLWKKTNV